MLFVRKGFFVTFEGGDGVGKSTQIKRLSDDLKNTNIDCFVTREPGGSPGAELVRRTLFSEAIKYFNQDIERLLFSAARLDHIKESIAPAMKKKKLVLCDRFFDSFRVYQSIENQDIQPTFVDQLAYLCLDGMMPDLTFIFDLEAKISFARMQKRQQTSNNRFDFSSLDIHERRRQFFLNIAAQEPMRCKVIDASKNEEDVQKEIFSILFPFLKKHLNISFNERKRDAF